MRPPWVRRLYLSLHLSASSTASGSGIALDFDLFRSLIHLITASRSFYSSDQRFAYACFQIPPREGHPWFWLWACRYPDRPRDFHPLDKVPCKAHEIGSTIDESQRAPRLVNREFGNYCLSAHYPLSLLFRNVKNQNPLGISSSGF